MQLQQIDYAPALPSQKRRRAIRRVAMGLAILVIAVLAIKSAPPAWRHMQILYWQRRAMTYTAPADQIVYDNDPSDIANLRKLNRSLITSTHGEVFEFAKPWDRFYQLASPPGRQPAATLFLHEMKNRQGESRLVVVEASEELSFYTYNGTRKWALGLGCAVLKPGGLFSSPQRLIDSSGSVIFEGLSKWREGQVDSKNPNHFTIQGVWNGTPVTIDGWLGHNDEVELSAPTTWRQITSPAPSSSAKSPPTAR